MAGSPVPERIPPLTWRRPTFLWTPLALGAAIGWPAALFYQDGTPQRFALIAGALIFAIALSTLGVSWALGRPPKARRIVVVHVVLAAALTALALPFVMTPLLSALADYKNSGDGESITLDMAMVMAPLALVIGLPIALISGILFAWIALSRRRADSHDIMGDDVFRRDVQPFR